MTWQFKRTVVVWQCYPAELHKHCNKRFAQNSSSWRAMGLGLPEIKCLQAEAASYFDMCLVRFSVPMRCVVFFLSQNWFRKGRAC